MLPIKDPMKEILPTFSFTDTHDERTNIVHHCSKREIKRQVRASIATRQSMSKVDSAIVVHRKEKARADLVCRSLLGAFTVAAVPRHMTA